jgi:hypothetical protein
VTPHARSVQLALRSNAALKTITNQMGTTDAPRGRVLSAYRQARRALSSVRNVGELRQVLAELRLTLEIIARSTLDAATQYGIKQATAELTALDIAGPPSAYAWQAALLAWLATIDAQLTKVQTLYVLGDGDLGPIVGDASRVGLLAPAPVVNEGAQWAAAVLAGAWLTTVSSTLQRTGQSEAYQRQAVAAIDERTTDCCLRVHGQVVELRERFHTPGTPHYAERQLDPPFHRYCRTTVCLVAREFADDALTVQMQDAAQSELQARAQTGQRAVIHPAHATSGRP